MAQQPSNFIQWKGTDVCIDVRCTCGRIGHYDGDFAHALRCVCGIVWILGTEVAMTVAKPSYRGILQDLKDAPDFDAEDSDA